MPQVALTELTEEEHLEQLLARSRERPQLLFKHSLTCPVSDVAHSAFLEYLGDDPEAGVDYAWLAVQKARPVSNSVADQVGVRHESPQMLLIQDGEAAWHASHWEITKDSLVRAVDHHRAVKA